jgi:histidine triad (HIT) family protein
MNECLFCSIITKEKHAYTIYEDEAVVAMLDIFPHAPAHTLVIPKRHMETVFDMKLEEMQKFWAGVNSTLEILKNTMSPDGFTIGINHGKVSGQAVEHLHIHCIPRWKDDGGGSIHSVIKNPGLKNVEEIYEKIQQLSSSKVVKS